MKPKNALQQWMRVLAGITAVMVLNLSFAQAASAKILFEDDAFFKVRSEGIVINENDSGDQDVSLKFGNDTTDALILFNDLTGDMTFSTPGGDFSFDNDNITTGGSGTFTGGITTGANIVSDTDSTDSVGTTGVRFLNTFSDTFTGNVLELDGATGVNEIHATDNVADGLSLETSGGDTIFTVNTTNGSEAINLNADITASSTTGFDFRSADVFAIRTTASSTAVCTYVGELIYDTEDTRHEFCTVVGNPGTWNSVSAGGTDMQAVYDADAPGAHEIVLDAGGAEAVEIIANANGDALFQLKSAGAAATLASFNDLGGNTLDVNTLAVDWDATGLFALDSTAGFSIDTVGTASNLSLTANGAADDLTIEVAGAFDSSLVLQSTGTGADAVDINATGTGGGITVNTTDGAFALTTAGAANGDITLTAADVFDIDSVDTLSLNSSAGAINIGDDAVAQNISIGTAGARTLQLGSASATAANIDAIAFSLDGSANSNINITNATASSGARTLTIGSSHTGAAAGDNANVAIAASATGSGVSNLTLSAGNGAPDAGENGDDVAIETEDDFLVESTGDIDFDGGAAFNVDTTGAISFDAAAASNFTTSVGALTLNGAAGVNIAGNAAEIDVTTTGAVDVNAGSYTLDTTGAFSLDGVTSSNVNIANTTASSGAQTLTIGASHTGGDAGDNAIVSLDASAGGSGTGTLNLDADDQINVGTNVEAKAFVFGNGTDDSMQFNANTFDVNGNGAGTFDFGAASNFTTSSGALTLNGNGGVNIVGNAAEVDVTTSGALDLNSGAFTLDGTTGSIDFTDTSNLTMTADAAGASRTLTISADNTNAAASSDSVIAIDAINTGGGTGTLNLDADNAINIGTNVEAKTFTFGNGTDDAFTFASSTFDVNAGGAVTIDSSGGTIGIGTDAVNQNINIGTAGQRTLQFGSTTANTSLLFDADGLIDLTSDDGSVALVAADTGNAGNDNIVFTVGNAAPNAGENGNDVAIEAEGSFIANATAAIDLDTAGTFDMLSAGAFSIDGTGASNLSATSGNLTLSTITSGDLILSGAGDITFDDAQLSAPVQLTDTATGFNAEYGTTGIIDAFNTLALFTAGNGADVIGVEDGSLANIDLANSSSVQDALEAMNTRFGQNNTTLYFQPEFPDVTIYADTSNNKGTLESFFDATEQTGYYNWTTTQAGAANDINIQFSFKLPTDFLDSPAFTFNFRTSDTTAANNEVEVQIYNVTDDALCVTSLANVSGTSDTWDSTTLSTANIESGIEGGDDGCSGADIFAAGEVVRVEMKLRTDGDIALSYADVGAIEFTYANNQ